MRAFQIAALDGPDALEPVERPDPEPTHFMSPGSGVVIDVQAAGVSFPDVLMSRGLYQMKPELPFVPGGEVAGTVVAGADGFSPGDRVAAMTVLGGFAERAVAPPMLTFRLPDALSFAEGAALVLNYHTVWFALVTRGRTAGRRDRARPRRRGRRGHGRAAGGAGAGRARPSRWCPATRRSAWPGRRAPTRSCAPTGAWKDEARSLGGVDVVVDPVGGDRFTDSLRSLREGGRVVVVGFTGGSIPEVRVNRLLLNNVSVVGAGWGAYAMGKPEYLRETGEELERLVESGGVRPVVGRRLAFADAAEALRVIERREALGKVVLER